VTDVAEMLAWSLTGNVCCPTDCPDFPWLCALWALHKATYFLPPQVSRSRFETDSHLPAYSSKTHPKRFAISLLKASDSLLFELAEFPILLDSLDSLPSAFQVLQLGDCENLFSVDIFFVLGQSGGMRCDN
jgi:hypothetical protein